MKLPRLKIAALLHDPGLLLRLAAATGLGLTLLLLLVGLVQTWRHDPLTALKAALAKPPRPAPIEARPAIDFYPAVPTLPDLNVGYLFNAERAGAGTTRGGSSLASVNVRDLTYAGSIIFGKIRKALLSFPVAGQGGEAGPGISSRPAGTGYYHVAPGDAIGGFTVSEILPEKIVFQRGGETVEKLLYDAKKQRRTPPPLRGGSTTVAVEAAPPPPAANTPPEAPPPSVPKAPAPRRTTATGPRPGSAGSKIMPQRNPPPPIGQPPVFPAELRADPKFLAPKRKPAAPPVAPPPAN